MKVVYNLSESDLGEAASRHDRKLARLACAGVGAVLAATLAGAGLIVPALLALLCGGVLAMLPLWQGPARAAVTDLDIAPRRLSFDNRGLLLETDLASEAYPWRSVRRLVCTRRLAIFELSDDEAIVAPLSAFKDRQRTILTRARLAIAAARGQL